MLSQTHLLCSRPFCFNKMATTSRAPFSVRVRSSTTSTPVAGDKIPAPASPETNFPTISQSLVAAAPPVAVARNLGLRLTPELGFLSHLFVLSMALAAFLSVAVVSIPTLIAFGRLGASVKKLSKVVSEEVPGTLSSLKLSSMELNELTQQLSSIRHKISGVPTGSKDGSAARSRSEEEPRILTLPTLLR